MEEWTKFEKSWLLLFKSVELRERLGYVDVAELRTAFYLKGWPVLGDTSEEDPFQESEKYMCTLLDDGGGQCGRVFDKLTALRCHQRCSEGGQHGDSHHSSNCGCYKPVSLVHEHFQR